eukprot:scaffold296165_cov35-Tisochrysis_lutea.AAC.1
MAARLTSRSATFTCIPKHPLSSKWRGTEVNAESMGLGRVPSKVDHGIYGSFIYYYMIFRNGNGQDKVVTC